MNLEEELRKAQAECERLARENAHLKSLLKTFSLQTGSSLLAAQEQTQGTAEPGMEGTVDSGLQPSEKISLFRSLFRGREDVYALRWTSKQGKSGYSPACANEWDETLCRKPCGKCKNASYLPVTDEVIGRHLEGKHTVGVYPLLLAAFHNPEFYKAQRMRMSTFGKPRIISCAEDFPKHLAVPRGCLEDLRAFGQEHGIEFDLQDERHPGNELTVTFQGMLREEQEALVRDLAPHDNGVLVAPTGFGKTTIAAWVIARRGVNTLILVHRKLLMEQWREQLALFLGLEGRNIGLFASGQKKKTTGTLDIALIQSLQRKGEVSDLIAEYGQIIVDECHHIPAFSMERVVRKAKAKYVLGLTATPVRRDGHHPIIMMQCGPIRANVNAKDVSSRRPFHHCVVFRKTDFMLRSDIEDATIHALYKLLVNDASRNQLIIQDVKDAVGRGRSPLVLSERTEHIELIVAELEKSVQNIIVLKGGMGKKQRMYVLERLREIPDGQERVIVATGRYAGEGFDDSRLDTLFLALPVSWRGVLHQYVGRLHRIHDAKREVQVYDYVDEQVPVLLRMYKKRLAGYHALGYQTDLHETLF